MFTGLIAGVGRLAARETRGGDARLRIDDTPPAKPDRNQNPPTTRDIGNWGLKR